MNAPNGVLPDGIALNDIEVEVIEPEEVLTSDYFEEEDILFGSITSSNLEFWIMSNTDVLYEDFLSKRLHIS